MKKESIRKTGITLAAILGLGTLLYLSGLVAQLNINYEAWLAAGGMTGAAQMAPLQYHPLICLRFAISPTGLRAALLILAIGAGIFVFLRLRDRFGGTDLDDRNFVRSKRGTYGTANWMTEKRKREILEVASPKKARGIILGREENGDVICLPEDTRYNKHVVIYGASGTMKSRGVIRPAIFQAIRRGESVLVSDPKSEIYSDCVELFKKHNYTIRVFNLVQPEFGDSWNAMFNLNGDTLMAQILTDIIISNTKGDNKGDHFWDNGEANLLKALILYVDQDTSRPPEQRNLPAVYQMLTRNTEKQLTAMFERLPVTHPAKASYWLFSQASDTCVPASCWVLVPAFRCCRTKPSAGSPARTTSIWSCPVVRSARISSSWTIRVRLWNSSPHCFSAACLSSSCAMPTASHASAATYPSISFWRR